MDNSLIDDDGFSLARKSVLPGRGFFIPDDLEESSLIDVTAELSEHETAVIADPDADGLACVALLRAIHNEVLLLPAGPHELEEALDLVAEYAPTGLTLYVCDLVPDDADRIMDHLERLRARDVDISWFDHHQWEADLEDTVRAAGVSLTVGDGEEECTADVVVRAIDYDFPAYLETLASVTRDHDLWIKADARSDDLADYAYWTDPETYVATIGEHGANLPDEVDEFLSEQRTEKHALIDRAVGRASYEDVGPWTIGVTYGRCSQNEVAERLRVEGADAAVVVKPAGSVSIRGSESFTRCHEVARLVGGGGHPKAAGCKPPIYDDMLDFAHHWVTEGAVTKRALLDAFERIAETAPSPTETT